MARKSYSAEQIIRLLRQSEVLSSEGRNVPEICREIGVTVILLPIKNEVELSWKITNKKGSRSSPYFIVKVVMF